MSRHLERSAWPVFALAATALACSASVSAQTLDELYQSAKDYDTTFLSAQAQAHASGYKTAEAKSKRLPTLGLTASIAHDHTTYPATNPTSVLPPPYNNLLALPGTLSNNTKQAALQAKQSLFNAADTAQIHQAERLDTAAQVDVERASQDLMVRVAQAYFDVLSAQDAVTTAQANSKGINEQLAAAKRNFEVGNATVTDSREAQARSDLARSQEIAANNDLRVKLSALEQLVGRKGVMPKALNTDLPLPKVMPQDAESWASLSESSPDVRKAQLNAEVAKLEIDNAKAGHLPTLDLVASLSRLNNSTAISTSQGAGTVSDANIALQLNLPLFAGFAVQNRVKETSALLEKAGFDLDTVKRNIAQGVRTTYYGIESGLAQVDALKAAENSSKLALEATQLGYRVGVRVTIDVLNAQTQLSTTQHDLAKARYDVLVGELKLRQLAGVLKEDDLADVSRLAVK